MSYTYDGSNALTAMQVGTGGPTTSGTSFAYDGNGNQTAAQASPGRSVAYNNRDQAITTTVSGGASTTSTYASGGNMERLSAGSSTFRTSTLSPAPSSTTNSGSTIWSIRDPDGNLLALRFGSAANPGAATSAYPFTDQVNSVRALVTSAGQQIAQYAYSSFGTTRSSSESLPSGLSNPYRYAAGFTDASSGLIKLGARYYDPSSGRFTQTDPSNQEANAYVYCGNNPISASDATGLGYVSVPSRYRYYKTYNLKKNTLNDWCSYSPDGLNYGGTWVDFRGPCARHDLCYQDGIQKRKCNITFLNQMQEQCSYFLSNKPFWRVRCYSDAQLYFTAVMTKNP